MRRLVLVLALLLLAGQPAAAREELTIGMTQFPSTLHPNIDSMAAKSYVLGMARRPFTTYDAQWQLICMLCTELPTMENGRAEAVDRPDGTRGVRVRYTIQPEARWGDGTPITTDDVVFTWEVGRHPQSGVANTELYRRIERIEVHDERTFTLHVTKLTFEFAAINDFQVLPAHIERARFEQDPVGYKERTAYNTDPTNPGLYFGPYRIVQVASGSHIVLERNRHWWGRAPAFNRITVRVIENTAALEANLLSGAIDYIAGELGVTLDQALALERRHGQRFVFRYKPGLIYEHIDLQLDNPILADRRVRRALLVGLDRRTLVRQLFDNRQPVAATFVNPLDWVADADLPPAPHDPAEAMRLLDEAGWNRMRDGVRHNAAGERLSLELMTTAGNRVRETVQQVMQSQWRRIGIEVRIRNEPARVFFGETLRRRQFTGLAMFAWISSPENVPRSTLHSNEIPRPENGFAGQNQPGFRNAEMDQLIDATEIELDRERRRVLWHRIQRIYADELPVLPLYFRADAYITPRWLAGIEPTGHQYPTTLWVENWHEQ
jgi:peptide/nickel transport system substrate-binding protein